MLLLYCITESNTTLTPPATGVLAASVESRELSDLRCFYSSLEKLNPAPDSLQRDALDFHRVTRELFQQTAIIPFRFPTTLSSLNELKAYLRDHAAPYHGALQDFRDTVQMEIRLQLPPPPAEDIPSGAHYLQTRAQRSRQVEQAISACRVAISEEVIDWRQRDSPRGVRCFVLIRREAVSGFQQQIKQVRLPEAAAAAISGPWPPTEFFPVFA
jgi:Gas vesicle synthesis protein GvpL/GvpF